MPEFTIISENIAQQMEKLRNINIQWNRNALRINYSINTGYFLTSIGNPQSANRYIPNSVSYELYDIDSNEVQPRPDEFFNQFQIELSCNCFGYCFADGELWLDDPSQIINDEYTEVSRDQADVIVFVNYDHINDSGQHVYKYTHAVKINHDGTVSFKPGMNALIENVPSEQAIHTYNYNHEKYYRKNTIT